MSYKYGKKLPKLFAIPSPIQAQLIVLSDAPVSGGGCEKFRKFFTVFLAIFTIKIGNIVTPSRNFPSPPDTGAVESRQSDRILQLTFN